LAATLKLRLTKNKKAAMLAFAMDLDNIICTTMVLVWKNILKRRQKYDTIVTIKQ
jgi:hypothetical protein